jgi:DNA-binding CsgD family transcriptional regulator
MGVPLYVEQCIVLPVVQISSEARVMGLVWRYGLHIPEARLALLLSDGLELMEAGRQLNYTSNTTRTYSKIIYSRLGIHTQAQLVSVIYKTILESLV